jgi:hypothetical protein
MIALSLCMYVCELHVHMYVSFQISGIPAYGYRVTVVHVCVHV